ncbi:MAG: hypothetical protein ACODAG_07355 [Myxococcota bacterium]
MPKIEVRTKHPKQRPIRRAHLTISPEAVEVEVSEGLRERLKRDHLVVVEEPGTAAKRKAEAQKKADEERKAWETRKKGSGKSAGQSGDDDGKDGAGDKK